MAPHLVGTPTAAENGVGQDGMYISSWIRASSSLHSAAETSVLAPSLTTLRSEAGRDSSAGVQRGKGALSDLGDLIPQAHASVQSWTAFLLEDCQPFGKSPSRVTRYQPSFWRPARHSRRHGVCRTAVSLSVCSPARVDRDKRRVGRSLHSVAAPPPCRCRPPLTGEVALLHQLATQLGNATGARLR